MSGWRFQAVRRRRLGLAPGEAVLSGFCSLAMPVWQCAARCTGVFAVRGGSCGGSRGGCGRAGAGVEELAQGCGVDVDEGGPPARVAGLLLGVPGASAGECLAGGDGDGAGVDDAVAVGDCGGQGAAVAAAVQVPGEDAELGGGEVGEFGVGGGELAGGGDTPAPLKAEGDGGVQVAGGGCGGGQPGGGGGGGGPSQDDGGGGQGGQPAGPWW